MYPMNSAFRFVVILALLFLTTCRSAPAPQSSSASDTPATKKSPVQVVAERPSLSGRVENISLYPVPNNQQDLAISVVLTINNSGSPGVAQDWSLSVSSPSGAKSAQPVHVNGVVELPGSGGGRVDLGKEDLALKSKQTPIAKGGTLKGIMTFVLPGVSVADLSNNGSTLAINFKDDHGGSYQTPRAIIGAKVKR
jgi:hypothetical protein